MGKKRSRLAAVVQLSSGSDIEANWIRAQELVRAAADMGARIVATPENTNFLGPPAEKARLAQSLEGVTCSRFAGLARELRIYLLLGSFNECGPDPEHCYNTSVLFGPNGERQAVYRKIHLFDVDLEAEGRFTESETVAPGEGLVTSSTSLGEIGLSVCYDLRFPELYRELTARGAQILSVPAAFTKRTGEAHWHLLVRARAVENQCYVVAPAQQGQHDDGGARETYGHSMIVDPWGRVLAEIEKGPGMALAELDLDLLRRIRGALPALRHRRL